MGRRSKADLNNLIDRILALSTKDKLTNQQIADLLRSEGIDISREAVRRSLKSARVLAQDLQRTIEEARVMMDVVRNNPNTDIAEAVVTQIGGLLLRESQEIDALEFADPGEFVLAAGRLANASAKIGLVKMKFLAGVEAAKTAVLTALKTEMKNHPDLLAKITEVVNGLEVAEK